MRTLYKDGNQVEIWGKQYDYIVVADSDVDAHLSDGWRLHPLDEAPQEKKRGRKPKGEYDGKDEG